MMATSEARCVGGCAAQMALAMGCSMSDSTAAATSSTSSVESPAAGVTATTEAMPIVRVPVLSKATVSTRANRSRASALRMRMPSAEARPQPTIMATGVAKPIAHGQATSRTAMELSTAVPKFEPMSHQPRNVRRGHQQHGRHEHPADAVGQPFERRLGAQRLVNDVLESRQDRFGRDGANLDDERAVAVPCARGHLAPGSVLDRQGLARQHRLVDRGPASDDLAVQAGSSRRA